MDEPSFFSGRLFALPQVKLVLAGLAGAALAGCGMSGPAHQPPAPGAAAAVEMGFSSFSPATLAIKAGQTVSWRNTSLISHTVTDRGGAPTKPNPEVLPAGAQPFESGDIPAGQVYSHRFDTVGTYYYICRYHDGMKGTITVAP